MNNPINGPRSTRKRTVKTVAIGNRLGNGCWRKIETERGFLSHYPPPFCLFNSFFLNSSSKRCKNGPKSWISPKAKIEGLEVKTENFDNKCLCILAYNKKKKSLYVIEFLLEGWKESKVEAKEGRHPVFYPYERR